MMIATVLMISHRININRMVMHHDSIQFTSAKFSLRNGVKFHINFSLHSLPNCAESSAYDSTPFASNQGDRG